MGVAEGACSGHLRPPENIAKSLGSNIWLFEPPEGIPLPQRAKFSFNG